MKTTVSRMIIAIIDVRNLMSTSYFRALPSEKALPTFAPRAM